LHTENIALSSTGIIYIYDSYLKKLIQKIDINKKYIIKYIYEFPDETILCACSSKIYRIKLIDNDTNFNVLGYIQLGKSELATKLISLGTNFLVALTEQKKLCNLKVFMKNPIFQNDDNKNEINSISNQNFFDNDISSYNSSDTKQKNTFNKDMIKIDNDFKICGGGNINKDKKLLCSIFGISKRNEHSYEFIATSNFVYDLGDNRIEFYEINQLDNNLLNISRTKLIEKISCSTVADSICQFNDDYLCVGLQNYDLKGQISGYAIIDINKKEINQIIKDNEIYCIHYIKEKNILMAAMEVRNYKGNYNMIKMYKIGINKEKNVEFEKIFQLKTKHENIIVSLLELKIIDNAPNQQEGFNFKNTDYNSNIICASASLDANVRIIQANI
jgi:hypothetical protein